MNLVTLDFETCFDDNFTLHSGDAEMIGTCIILGWCAVIALALDPAFRADIFRKRK
jgi:hypothetical protein